MHQMKLKVLCFFAISCLVCAFGQELDWPTYLRVKDIVLDGPEPFSFENVEYYTILRFEPDEPDVRPEWQIRIAKPKQGQGFEIVYRRVVGPKHIGAQVDEIVKKTISDPASIAARIPVRERRCHVADVRVNEALEALKDMQMPFAVRTKQYLTGYQYTLAIRGPSEDIRVSQLSFPPDAGKDGKQAKLVQWMNQIDRIISGLCGPSN